ncbi:MAG: hypothetical protein QM758_05245 [Armatimonas sp.]
MNETTEKLPDTEIGNSGVYQGAPPARRIHHVTVLDMRGVPAEHVTRIQEIGNSDVILLDDENRLALNSARLHHIGTVVVAHPDEKVLVTPQLDLSASAVESLAPGQRWLVVGNLHFQPGVAAAQIAEKFLSLRVTGVMVACHAVQGALLSKLQMMSGVVLSLPDDVGPLARDGGETRITDHYLLGLPDGTTYLNFGNTELDPSVSHNLLERKIASYVNTGQTRGPAELISFLQARCPTNLGSFRSK